MGKFLRIKGKQGFRRAILPEATVFWVKISPEADRIKIYEEANLVFPLLVAQIFARGNIK